MFLCTTNEPTVFIRKGKLPFAVHITPSLALLIILIIVYTHYYTTLFEVSKILLFICIARMLVILIIITVIRLLNKFNLQSSLSVILFDTPLQCCDTSYSCNRCVIIKIPTFILSVNELRCITQNVGLGSGDIGLYVYYAWIVAHITHIYWINEYVKFGLYEISDISYFNVYAQSIYTKIK